MTDAGQPPAPEPATEPSGGKTLTIGAVTKALQAEFPDISISKIRYLEDQKLLTPARTAGGYRLYSAADVQRLRTILRLQRDEFLPLRVIRQALDTGRADELAGDPAAGPPGTGPAAPPVADTRPGAALRRATFSIRERGSLYTLEDVVEQTGAPPGLVKDLEDFGLVRGEPRDGRRWYDDAERDIVRAAMELARYGVAPRNLRAFKTSADRESALLQQILAPALRSRNPERRREALDTLESLAAVASHLKHLLLARDLRRIAQ